jgi:hypothetical protein
MTTSIDRPRQLMDEEAALAGRIDLKPLNDSIRQ